MADTQKGGGTNFMAALTGLIVGGCILFAVLFSIVVITARSYPAESSTAAASQ